MAKGGWNSMLGGFKQDLLPFMASHGRSEEEKESSLVWRMFKNHRHHIWGFPKIGVPRNHPFIDGFPIINHPLWDPSFIETPIYQT